MNDLDQFRRYFAEPSEDKHPTWIGCATTTSDTGDPCPWPAVRLVFTACVHKHIGPTFECAEHTHTEVRLCAMCHAAGHSCELTVIDAPGQVDEWLFERITPENAEGLDPAEWRQFVRDNLHRLVPDHLRQAS